MRTVHYWPKGEFNSIIYLRLRTTNRWISSLGSNSNCRDIFSIFLKKRWKSWSTDSLRKCFATSPSMVALTCIVYACPLMGPSSLDAGFVNSILSMLKHPFLSTSAVSCSREGLYSGWLKESAWASLIIPCN